MSYSLLCPWYLKHCPLKSRNSTFVERRTEVIESFQQLQKAGVTKANSFPKPRGACVIYPHLPPPFMTLQLGWPPSSSFAESCLPHVQDSADAIPSTGNTLPLPLRPTRSSGLLTNGRPHDRQLLTNPNTPGPLRYALTAPPLGHLAQM